ncbi:ferredoxin:protochlorophyllide reductase (ATP-dependent) subunit B [Thiorhodococcus mannitoliphagus]|uniref:Light-independent protochlorophyllide reductase subunit B n=1 Tax=Thiorhodococcus mannitoliphagus TaxID=329406 RepID=A0A6P1DTB3_9GAMM|nr:ferredoxin:protochlorophyllide reductase (ATP-dependent) subunit B [Thiorhodococcus mannitoliphagus]NEX18914.1 ferredoxin:protochlorophyllide reductase (ATP-dependent) subunit B [Thiorhodococcus mannitoliphagus]
MQLTLWSYEGPPHIGAMRIAVSMEGVHLVLHAPQGDTYADLLFTMIERRGQRPPVTYTTFQARELGGDTAGLVKTTIQEAYDRFKPRVLMIGESCTAELIQDQPTALAQGMGLPVPVLPLELPAYTRKEGWGANETFYQLVRGLLKSRVPTPGAESEMRASGPRPKANLLGPTALGFRCRDDVVEVTRLLDSIGVDVNVIAPLGATPEDLLRIPEADINLCLYPEVADQACHWLERMFGQPTIKTVPIGIGATHDFIQEVGRALQLDLDATADPIWSRMPWYSRSVDSTYLTGKRVFIFGDATHVVASARIASEELGFKVVGLGTYAREFAREVRDAAKHYGVEPLITDDYLEVEKKVAELHPELVLGTQMERHIAKRLGVPCAVISAPVHIQDFPSRYAPQMGFEGANVIFDTWVHPLMMGLEEHLITMFREDFEFHDAATPSHLGSSATPGRSQPPPAEPAEGDGEAGETIMAWAPDAEQELKKIPFFVRGKARRNTERYAQEQGIQTITVETLYDAKAHFGR